MESIDWTQIDDYTFVKLVGEMLTQLGFVNVDYQGVGPDGGIDLFATELVPFTVQGRIPFRWAIQCKFSRKGVNESVNDAEVRDIEGILRSERYQAQELRGYLLVTNRKVTQNVIERLRGTDRRSQFRAAWIDGAGIENLLRQHDQIYDRYFGKRPYLPIGPPAVITSPRAEVAVRIRTTGEKMSIPVETKAVIDTGAEITVIPPSVSHQIDAKPVGMQHIQTTAGQLLVNVALVEISLEGNFFKQVGAVVADVPYVLIGRDFLQGMTVVLEPNGAIRVYPEKNTP